MVPWDTPGVPQGPPGQTNASQICSIVFSGSHYGLETCQGSPFRGAFLAYYRHLQLPVKRSKPLQEYGLTGIQCLKTDALILLVVFRICVHEHQSSLVLH